MSKETCAKKAQYAMDAELSVGKRITTPRKDGARLALPLLKPTSKPAGRCFKVIHVCMVLSGEWALDVLAASVPCRLRCCCRVQLCCVML